MRCNAGNHAMLTKHKRYCTVTVTTGLSELNVLTIVNDETWHTRDASTIPNIYTSSLRYTGSLLQSFYIVSVTAYALHINILWGQ